MDEARGGEHRSGERRATVSRRTLLRTAGAGAMLAGSSSGCASRKAPSGATRVTMWSWLTGMDRYVEAFNASQREVFVDLSVLAGGLSGGYAQQTNAIRAHNAPDIMHVEYQGLPQVLTTGGLREITEDMSDLASGYSSAAWQSVRPDGRTWAVPFDVAPMVLYYRKDLFDSHGLAVPGDWRQFRRTAEEVRRIDPAARLTTFPLNDGSFFAGMAWQARDPWWEIREHSWKVSIDGAGTTRTARYWQELIDAGPADEEPNIHNPQGWPAMLAGPLDWSVMTAPQKHAHDRSLFWPRGRVLGGSSSLNGMIYIRGHRSDYDSWAYHGCPGWDWDSVLPLFKRSEDHADGASEWHGAGGPLPVSRIADPHPTAAAFVDGAVDLGYERTDDFNGERMEGAGFNHATIRDGKRMSAWQSFAAPVLASARLTVTTGALVHRVVFEGERAVGVEYERGDRLHTARAGAEVVLSAGVIGSARLLLLSGIGSGEHLGQVGVPVHTDLPGVGENLHDHLLVSNVYESSKPLPAGKANLLESQLFARSDSRMPAPDLQPLFLHIVYPAEGYPQPEHGYTIAPGLVRPLSRGTLRLTSTDPGKPAVADPNILAETQDLEALVDAVEMCREIGASAAFDEWREVEVAPGPQARTREHLRDYVRRAAGTYHHQVGTCRMGSDSMAVVGPELRVRGVSGLRVADASIMPSVPSGNTNAPSIMVGEKAADLLLSAS